LATLSITVPDDKVSRIQAAFGSMIGQPATNAEIRAALLDFVRRRVREYEAELAANTTRNTNDAEAWS